MPDLRDELARGACSSVGVGMRSSLLRNDLPLFRGVEFFQGSVNPDGVGSASFHSFVLLSLRSGSGVM